jgi:hypothetical protein
MGAPDAGVAPWRSAPSMPVTTGAARSLTRPGPLCC